MRDRDGHTSDNGSEQYQVKFFRDKQPEPGLLGRYLNELAGKCHH